MGCSACGDKPKKDNSFTKAVVKIENPGEITLIRKVTIPASMGDDTTIPPTVGKYKNVLLYYEANSKSFLYSSDGIPTQLVNGFTNYEEAINLPEINGVTLMGNKSSADLKLADAPMVITVADGNISWSGADTAEDVYDFFLNKGKVNIVFNGEENYAYEVASAAYIPGEEKMMCTLAVATIATGETAEFEGNALFGTMTLYTADKAIDVSQIELQPKLFVADFTGLDLNYNELSGVPATNASIGMVKPGDGLEVASDGTLSISEIEQYAHFFDTVADMKASTNLSDGDYAKTLGFYAVNDGGEALYKIRTKTESDSPNELDLIAVGANLVAEIVITGNMSVKQFGAKATGVDDDKNAISQMISKCGYLYVPAGDYLIGSQLVIGQVRDINIKGNIVYTGTDYAILFTGGNYLNINIKSITCNDGGCVKIAPTSSSPFSFSRIDIQYGTAKYHVVEMDGDNNAICNIFFDGIRWRSTDSTSCNVTMTNGASNTSFVNEIIFENVNFWTAARTRAGMSVNNASSNEVQLKFEKVNFENSWGIHTVGKVNNIVINDCRIIEIQNDQGWLTFDGYLPKVFISGVGDNYLNIGFITLSNITDNSDFLTTNMTVQDNVTTYLFAGGCVSNRNFTTPFKVPRVMKEYDTTGNITFSDLVMGGGNYNQFRFKGNGWVVFTIPGNLWLTTDNNIVIKTDYSISFTLTDGQNTQTFQTEANGMYRATKVGTVIAMEKLALPA